MKNVLDWMKANIMTVASIVVIVASLGVIAWVSKQRQAFTSEVQTRVENQSRDIEQHMSRSVQIPPDRPDAPPETVSRVTVTDGAIRELERLYGRINEEYDEVFQRALAFNRANHEPLVEGLFPDATGPRAFDARIVYRQAFEEMMGRAEGSDGRAPRLNAGMPPSQNVIDMQLEQLDEQIRATFPTWQRNELSQDETRQLHAEKSKLNQALLRERARQIHLYAVQDPTSSNFPFQIGSWSDARDRPQPQQLWEGQLELWIQQDIARAIARANRADDPNASVIDAPVKRLLRVEVVPGYVGLHTLGGIAGGSTGRQSSGGYSAPENGQRGQQGGALPVNFNVGPTGRVSNAMYDVRHVRMVAIVEDQKLPEFFDALGAVNFMTVLQCNLRDVDEYEALRDGFVYGTGNAVEADMIIETIWLREWTRDLMPPRVRGYLGIEEPRESGRRF